jgi:hypothetical protein
MSLSKEERSAINRQNRTQHGLRASPGPLDDESQDEYDALKNEWMDFFRPADPVQRANVERGIHATELQKRSQRFFKANVKKQARRAQKRAADKQKRAIAAHAERLKSEPKMSVLLLKEIAD